MNASDITALCSVVIAFVALVVLIFEAMAGRRHDRLSALPILQMNKTLRDKHTAGIRLRNVGLGPAKVIETTFRFNGHDKGQWNESTADEIKKGIEPRPHSYTLGGEPILGAGFDSFLLSVDDFDASKHAALAGLIDGFELEIRYQSLYGRETYVEKFPSAR